ncbi:menaquinone-dependent protoporphyrinogen IX dehydrogenase [Consotaella aegiceratis]|uniref:menaquinone-dependent protoporphyrinogen IX dehydrogenase n=1 Tax=Consotaella aegiceratis TaxID=3097961 RepID=UPI002F4272F9
MHLCYATRDGQSRRIAHHVSEFLARRGLMAPLVDLARDTPPPEVLAREAPLVVILSVRYGRHLPEGVRFLQTIAALPSPPPLFLASVNLTARKPAKQTAETNVYLRKLIQRTGVEPALATALAGRLDYPRYTTFDRFMIRLIMRMTGGPTDPGAVVEYTDWDKVDAFGAAIAEHCDRLHRSF